MLLFIVAGFYSCLDDKNSFDYKQVNELDGAILNMDEYGYEVNVGEELTISPTFKFTIDKENPDVSYEWYLDGKKLDATTPSYTFLLINMAFMSLHTRLSIIKPVLSSHYQQR